MSYRCAFCEAPHEDENGKHSYYFWQGVLTENVPNEASGMYELRPISGSLDPKPFGNPPRSFCTLECMMNWIISRRKVLPLAMPKAHPLNR